MQAYQLSRHGAQEMSPYRHLLHAEGPTMAVMHRQHK